MFPRLFERWRAVRSVCRRVIKTRPPSTSPGAARNPTIGFSTFLADVPSCTALIWRTTTTQLCSQLFSAVALRQLCRVALHKSCVDSHESWFRRCFSLSMSGKAGRAAWMSSSEHNLAEFAPARASLNGRFVVYKSYDDLRRSSCPGGYKRVTARWGA